MLLEKKGRDEFYTAIAKFNDKQKDSDPIFDEAWNTIGNEAVAVCKKDGFFPMFQFVKAKVEPKLAKVKIPLSQEALTLRAQIEKDIEFRAKTGFSFNPSSSEEDQTRRDWNNDPELRREFGDNFGAFSAYKKALGEGRIRISSKKIIRREVDERQSFNIS